MMTKRDEEIEQFPVQKRQIRYVAEPEMILSGWMTSFSRNHKKKHRHQSPHSSRPGRTDFSGGSPAGMG